MKIFSDLIDNQLSYHSVRDRETVEVNISKDESLMLIEIDCPVHSTKRVYRKVDGEWVKGKGQRFPQEDPTLVQPGRCDVWEGEKLKLPSYLRHLL